MMALLKIITSTWVHHNITKNTVLIYIGYHTARDTTCCRCCRRRSRNTVTNTAVCLIITIDITIITGQSCTTTSIRSIRDFFFFVLLLLKEEALSTKVGNGFVLFFGG